MANLIDLVEDGVMKYDGYEGAVFGNLTVLGWNGKRQNNKKYIVLCSICKEDTELCGEGLFLTKKGHLERGCIPCGCTDKCKWTEGQYKVRVARACTERGLVFKGWYGTFSNANNTKVTAECSEHGEFSTMTISYFLIKGGYKGCAGCFALRMGDYKRKEDSLMITKFMDSGGFPLGTLFTRSERVDKNGYKKYWYIDCPVCNTRGEGHVVGLYKGSKSCDCSVQTPKETYINLIKDQGNIIAIKFGVANNCSVRIKDQQSSCMYDVVPYGIWTYEESQSCKGAERTCMHTMPVGLLSKTEMPDGYTETTSPLNIESVIRIFEEYGGVRNI